MPEASASGFPACLNYFGRNGLNNMKQKFYYGLKLHMCTTISHNLSKIDQI